MGNDGVMADVAQRVGADLLTVGVEEEFLLVDPATGAATPAVEAVIAEVPPDLRGQVQREFQTSQIEIGSPPGLELSALRHGLGMLRAGLSEAAERAGVRMLAVGTGPVSGEMPGLVDDPRFHRMIERYGMLAPGPGYNGMHVHVGVPEPEVGVQVLNRLRPWLPIVHAATANSPFFDGRDSGYACSARCCGTAGRRSAPPRGSTRTPTTSAWSSSSSRPACSSTRGCSTGTPGSPRTCRRWRSASATSARASTTRS